MGSIGVGVWGQGQQAAAIRQRKEEGEQQHWDGANGECTYATEGKQPMGGVAIGGQLK